MSASDSRFAYCFNFSVLFAASKGTVCSVSTKIQGHTPPKVSVLHFVLHFTVTSPLCSGSAAVYAASRSMPTLPCFQARSGHQPTGAQR